MPRGPPPYQPPHFDSEENREVYGNDDITKHVRVNVPDFHGKLDSYAFQDCLLMITLIGSE